MHEVDEQRQFLKLIAKRLDEAGIPYMATGSMAMAVYSVARMTRDIDVVVACDLSQIDRMVALFAHDCYIDRNEVLEAIQSRSMFNVIHNAWVTRADFILRKNDEYRKLEMERRRQVDLDDQPVWIVSPEDLILSKLVWSKDSRSEMQRRDVRALLETRTDLDWAYLEKWAQTLSVTEQLEEARLK